MSEKLKEIGQELGSTIAKEVGEVVQKALESAGDIVEQVTDHTVPSLLALLARVRDTTIDRKLKIKLGGLLGLIDEPSEEEKEQAEKVLEVGHSLGVAQEAAMFEKGQGESSESLSSDETKSELGEGSKEESGAE